MPTLREAWRAARARLSAGSPSATLDAQVLLTHIIGAHDRAYLFAHPEQPLTPEQAAQYEAAVTRREAGEPLAYIRGVQPWYDQQIIVTPDVLIPRPETEHLIEAALAYCQQHPTATVADVCTGSGALAVALKANAPGVTVHATDISPAALGVARRNAEAAGVAVAFHQGDLLQPLQEARVRVEVLISNPPYIPASTLDQLEVSKHEPRLALDGGDDGLDLVRRLVVQARDVCQPAALMLVEIGADQGEAVLALAQETLDPAAAEIRQDYAGHDRFLYVRL